MTESLFNTPEETATRLTLCLPGLSNPATIERITTVDLVATYMREFGFGETNLHGDSPFAREEYEARRTRVRDGVKALVVRGLATTGDGGITFSATEQCEAYGASLHGEYARAYREAVEYLDSVEQDMLTNQATGTGGKHA